jgi:hypothetical protein
MLNNDSLLFASNIESQDFTGLYPRISVICWYLNDNLFHTSTIVYKENHAIPEFDGQSKQCFL